MLAGNRPSTAFHRLPAAVRHFPNSIGIATLQPFPAARRAMTPEQFIATWKNNPLTERAGAQADLDVEVEA